MRRTAALIAAASLMLATDSNAVQAAFMGRAGALRLKPFFGTVGYVHGATVSVRKEIQYIPEGNGFTNTSHHVEAYFTLTERTFYSNGSPAKLVHGAFVKVTLHLDPANSDIAYADRIWIRH